MLRQQVDPLTNTVLQSCPRIGKPIAKGVWSANSTTSALSADGILQRLHSTTQVLHIVPRLPRRLRDPALGVKDMETILNRRSIGLVGRSGTLPPFSLRGRTPLPDRCGIHAVIWFLRLDALPAGHLPVTFQLAPSADDAGEWWSAASGGVRGRHGSHSSIAEQQLASVNLYQHTRLTVTTSNSLSAS